MRAMWGTARPMKATGPQKAVAEAVSTPVTASSCVRRRRVATPRFSAYCSPRSSALSGLASATEQARPAAVTAAISGTCRMGTPPKLPRPHTM